MKRYSKEISKNTIDHLADLYFKEEALRTLHNPNSENVNTAAYSICVDKYSEIFAERQKLMKSIEKDVLMEYAGSCWYGIQFSFISNKIYLTIDENTCTFIDKLESLGFIEV